MMTDTNTTTALIDRWAAAELAGDRDALDDLAADDFLFVGPFGFLLERDQWVNRFAPDGLHYTRFDVDDVRPRDHGDVTIVVAAVTQEGSYGRQPADGRFRATILIDRTGDEPRIAGGQFSQLVDAAAAAS